MVARSATRPLVVDALLGVMLVAAGQVEVWTGSTDVPLSGSLLAVLGTAPVILRRRLPMVCLVAVLSPLWLLALQRSDSFSVAHLLAMMVATYSVAAHRSRGPAVAGLLLAIASALVNTAAALGWSGGDFLFAVILLAGPWIAGRALRVWRARTLELEALTLELREQREESTRLAVSAERGKIARDLHDSLAQSLHVVVIHAEAAEEALGRYPDRTRESLHRIQTVGREALAQTKHMLGILRSPEAATDVVVQPKLADLDSLVASVRSAGLSLELCVEGAARTLPTPVDMSAYRIIQESLTNVLKHAHAGAARVVVRYGVDTLDLEITDDGRGVTSAPEIVGYGLLGMRERTLILGGSLSAETLEGGGYGVHARLPLEHVDQ
ncbi:MAG TPA: histidine kinase [Nocardioidaceae bacterium]|nr:histidine kinase [Nocardioidaceae bacterium]